MEKKIEEIKKALFMEGLNTVEDFLGIEPGIQFDKDAYEKEMDEVFIQMPEEEIEKYYQKYVVKDSKKLYFVSQSNHGHEYVWIFDEDGLKASSNYELIKDELAENDYANVDIFWPMGGSNVSATYIKALSSEEEAKTYLEAEADGPDSEDPMLVEIAEYLRTVDTDWGSVTQTILDKFSLKAENLTKTDSRYDELIMAGVKPEEFYGDRSDDRYSEVMKELTCRK